MREKGSLSLSLGARGDLGGIERDPVVVFHREWNCEIRSQIGEDAPACQIAPTVKYSSSSSSASGKGGVGREFLCAVADSYDFHSDRGKEIE